MGNVLRGKGFKFFTHGEAIAKLYAGKFEKNGAIQVWLQIC